jgi:hypothetical protein
LGHGLGGNLVGDMDVGLIDDLLDGLVDYLDRYLVDDEYINADLLAI